ncbi:hypothetical protein B0H19DRAFT_1250832 [Mycena capillaripes]|nr:hypothetical protein B0H19DRAFT_1250832 [Mycena capillaripes]
MANVAHMTGTFKVDIPGTLEYNPSSAHPRRRPAVIERLYHTVYIPLRKDITELFHRSRELKQYGTDLAARVSNLEAAPSASDTELAAKVNAQFRLDHKDLRRLLEGIQGTIARLELGAAVLRAPKSTAQEQAASDSHVVDFRDPHLFSGP